MTVWTSISSETLLHFHQISSSFIFKFLNLILFYWVDANFLFKINTEWMILQRTLKFKLSPILDTQEAVKVIFQNSNSIGSRVNEFWPRLHRLKFSDRNSTNLWRITLRWNGMENFRSLRSFPSLFNQTSPNLADFQFSILFPINFPFFGLKSFPTEKRERKWFIFNFGLVITIFSFHFVEVVGVSRVVWQFCNRCRRLVENVLSWRV